MPKSRHNKVSVLIGTLSGFTVLLALFNLGDLPFKPVVMVGLFFLVTFITATLLLFSENKG